MSNWFPGTARIVDNGFGGDREGYGINGVIIHHTATVSDAFGYMSQWNDRDSHPTYHIIDGEVRGIVHPNRRPSSTAHGVDAQCITVEVNNIAGAPDWPVGGASINSLAAVIAHHARESGYGRAAASIRGVDQPEFFVGWHSQYTSTACPGPELARHIDWIVNMVNTILNPPAPTPTPEPVKVVWNAYGPVDMVTTAIVNIFEIGTGKILGTIDKGVTVTIGSEVTLGSVRYFRSSWASERDLNNGLDASLFELPAIVVPEPEPEPPVIVPEPDPVDVIVDGAVNSVPLPSDATQIQYPGKAVARTVVAVLAVVIPGANIIAATLNQYLVSQGDAAIPPVVFLALNGVIVVTGLIIGAVTRIMAIPGVNAWLTKLGIGATPAVSGKHLEGGAKHSQ